MPIYPYPQHATGLIVPGQKPDDPLWHKWLTDIRDQINLGENPSTTQDIFATIGIKIPSAVTNIIVRIQGNTAGTIDITANPQILAGFDGQVITIEGQSATNLVKLDNGDGLVLTGAASFTLGENDIIRFHYNKAKTVWIEHYRANN